MPEEPRAVPASAKRGRGAVKFSGSTLGSHGETLEIFTKRKKIPLYIGLCVLGNYESLCIHTVTLWQNVRKVSVVVPLCSPMCTLFGGPPHTLASCPLPT